VIFYTHKRRRRYFPSIVISSLKSITFLTQTNTYYCYATVCTLQARLFEINRPCPVRIRMHIIVLRERAREQRLSRKKTRVIINSACVCVRRCGVLFLVDFGERKYNIVFGEKDIIIWSPYV